jgi:hypothetical protein
MPDVTISSTYIPRDKSRVDLVRTEGRRRRPDRPRQREGAIRRPLRPGRARQGRRGEHDSLAEPRCANKCILDYLEKNPKTLGFKFLARKSEPQMVVDATVK